MARIRTRFGRAVQALPFPVAIGCLAKRPAFGEGCRGAPYRCGDPESRTGEGLLDEPHPGEAVFMAHRWVTTSGIAISVTGAREDNLGAV